MTTAPPLCLAEENALKATALEAFPINLQDVRRNVQLILTEFGRHGFFDEYTVHDFSHCHEMLKLLDWLVPTETTKIMSAADWLMTVLACYLHDLGLIITQQEFRDRDRSAFPDFCRDKLFSGADGADYRAKVDQLLPEDRERFLYQEFVRANHGARIKAWIEGKRGYELGYARAAAEGLDDLLSKLSLPFRRDLALVCESHNLDDLDDLTKYRLSQPYGNSEAETVNLQYAAVLLRTVDLLQITKHRAPTVLYRIISPTDPVSQREWAKQNAVTRIRPKIGIDADGNPDPAAPRDTIEVFAHFTNENGFFGLTSYLAYARKQLQQSHEVIERMKRLRAAEHNFPWRNIDDDQVKAEGFLKETFGFELDQARILDLLTGHTLYNDSAVVIRELVQNSIDAVRLRCHMDGTSAETHGTVQVHWDPKKATLEVLDNGTGMSQEIIEKHLLKVGSSRYQDSKFREQFPTFSSISRFGIGVLSAFMIADTVEIITSFPEEPDARQISLRSVHGKYLIRLLDKHAGPDANRISKHGTIVRLKLRPSVKPVDVVAAIRQWVVIPGCNVSVSIGEENPTRVGYSNPKEALEAFVTAYARVFGLSRQNIKVIQKNVEGCTAAFALEWSPLFRDWSFLRIGELRHLSPQQRLQVPLRLLCTCIEGIGVEFSTPGYAGHSVAAIANATGVNSPKTNVARSSLEDTKESEELRRKIYQIYMQQVQDEVDRLQTEEKYTITWAIGQVPFITSPLVSRNPSRPELQREALDELPMYLVEDKQGRRPIPLKELKASGTFWTVQSELMRSAERLVREAPAEITARLSYASLQEGGG